MAKAKAKAAPKKAVVKKAAAPKKAAVKKAAAPKKVAVKKAAAPKKAAVKKVAAPKKIAAPKKAVVKATKPPVPKGSYTKGDIIDHLAFNLDVTKKMANDFLNQLNTMVAANAKKAFTIPGLGKFHVVKTKKRNGRNPATGKAIVIPAKTKVKFRVGKALQDAVYPPKKK